MSGRGYALAALGMLLVAALVLVPVGLYWKFHYDLKADGAVIMYEPGEFGRYVVTPVQKDTTHE